MQVVNVIFDSDRTINEAPMSCLYLTKILPETTGAHYNKYLCFYCIHWLIGAWRQPYQLGLSLGLRCLTPFSTIFQLSWRLGYVNETGVPWENNRPADKPSIIQGTYESWLFCALQRWITLIWGIHMSWLFNRGFKCWDIARKVWGNKRGTQKP